MSGPGIGGNPGLGALLANVDGLLILLDGEGEGVVLFAGGTASGFADIPVGSSFLDSLHEEDRASFRQEQRLLAPGARVRLALRLGTREGRYGLFGLTLVNLREDPAVQAFVLTVRASSPEPQRLEGLGRLAGGISHDLNNLLTGILGNASLALTDLSPSDPAQGSVAAVERTAQRAAILVRQLRDYAVRTRPALKAIDLSRVVDGVSQLLRTVAPPRIELRLQLERALPAVLADVGQVQQIVLNLVTNAVEALPEGPGVITIATRPEESSGDDSGREGGHEGGVLRRRGVWIVAPAVPRRHDAVLEVTDTGSGLVEDAYHRIFEPGFSSRPGARGLGLTAVLEIVRAHRGALFVSSAPGSGATFRIHLPTAG